MKVVVTGAAGFLGRHVARRFRDSGWSVIGVDLEPWDEPGIEPFIADFTQVGVIDPALDGAAALIHIGAIGDVYLAGTDPSLAASVNVVGTARVIDSALNNGVRVIYASTWEVYGDPVYQPMDEAHPTMPDHPYSITKLAGESLTLSAARLNGLSAVALRLGTAYGSGLRRNSVFRIFIDRARRGEPISIQGDGLQGRQFTHASDLAAAFELAARSDVSGIAINVVAPDMISIRTLAELVVERYPTQLIFSDPRPGEVAPAEVSSDLAARELGWKAETRFAQGLTELMDDAIDAG